MSRCSGLSDLDAIEMPLNIAALHPSHGAIRKQIVDAVSLFDSGPKEGGFECNRDVSPIDNR